MSHLLHAWGEERSPLCLPALLASGTPHTSPCCPLISSLAMRGASVPPAADMCSSKTPQFSWGVARPVGTWFMEAVTSLDLPGG